MPEEDENDEPIDLSSITLDRRAQSDRRTDERRQQARRSDEDRRKDNHPIDIDDRWADERRSDERRESDRRATPRRDGTEPVILPDIDWESEELPVDSPSRMNLRLVILLIVIATLVAVVLY